MILIVKLCKSKQLTNFHYETDWETLLIAVIETCGTSVHLFEFAR